MIKGYKMEQNYDFRKRLDRVHKENIFDPAVVPETDECMIDPSWEIVQEGNLFKGCAALDLQDYLLVSMNISIPVYRKISGNKNALILEEDPSDKGFDVSINKNTVRIKGNTRKGVHYLEDLMNLRSAPFLKVGTLRSDPVFTPRMIHSGWAQDTFPDSHLDAISHAGFDNILLFVTGVNKTTYGYLDFNDLIHRAERYGLGVYFYSYLNSFKHPDDPDAEDFFDANFGSVFKNSPKAKGIILVGESCAFPSRDPRCSSVGADGRVIRPGFFPADDYPDWLNMVKGAVRKYAPQADVVFWTYNWGNSPVEERLALLRKLPSDVSIEVTFEMFEQIQYPNHTMKVPDYTITFPGPGYYFCSEAEELSKRKLPLYTISNTAGCTWDCGVMPYMPVPQQFFKRFRSMLDAHEKWNLTGIMDGHHYGWFPNPVVECARWCFNTRNVTPEVILEKIAIRDFGKEAAPLVLDAWQHWSDAMASFTPGFDDQCGPLRIGPSYPFIFYPVLYPFAEQNMHFPFPAHAYRGERILNTLYKVEQVPGHTFIGRRLREDLKILPNALALWEEGEKIMDEALKKVPERKREEAILQAGVGKFYTHTLRTMLGIKKWYLANRKLEVTESFEEANLLLDEMENILKEERQNVLETIPLVENDSRLGWEPTMEYACDKKLLEWKIEKIDGILKYTIPNYRLTVKKY